MKRTDSKILKSVLILLALTMLVPAAGVLAAGDVSFNKGTVERILSIEDVDIPEAVAKAIVKYRETNGPFKAPVDLLKVPGMTKDLYDEIDPVLTEKGDVIYDSGDSDASMKAY